MSLNTSNSESILSNRVWSFFQSLPQTCDRSNWMQQIRRSLILLFQDVDLLVVSTNYSPQMVFSRQEEILGLFTRCPSSSTPSAVLPCVRPLHTHSERLLSLVEQSGVNLNIYQVPYTLEIDFQGNYLGTLILFKEKIASTIKTDTLDAVWKLRPFLQWLFSGAGIKERYQRPQVAIRPTLTLMLQNHLRLSAEDQFILTLLLSGYSYKQTAETMGVTIDTVKKHMKKVYSRAGVGSLAELWTKYYPQRWDDGCSCAPGNEFINGGTQRRTGSHDA